MLAGLIDIIEQKTQAETVKAKAIADLKSETCSHAVIAPYSA